MSKKKEKNLMQFDRCFSKSINKVFFIARIGGTIGSLIELPKTTLTGGG